MTGCQINTLTIKIIFSDFMSSHCVQTHPTFAFLWIGATAHECCAVRHWQVLLFQQVTVHSLHVTSEHMAVPRKYSVSQHGSQKNVLHTSMSSTTFNKKCTPVQKISPQHTAMLQTYVQKYLYYEKACSWKSHKNMLTQSHENDYHIYPNITWEFFPKSSLKYWVWLWQHATWNTFCIHEPLKIEDYEETLSYIWVNTAHIYTNMIQYSAN